MLAHARAVSLKSKVESAKPLPSNSDLRPLLRVWKVLKEQNMPFVSFPAAPDLPSTTYALPTENRWVSFRNCERRFGILTSLRRAKTTGLSHEGINDPPWFSAVGGAPPLFSPLFENSEVARDSRFLAG